MSDKTKSRATKSPSQGTTQKKPATPKGKAEKSKPPRAPKIVTQKDLMNFQTDAFLVSEADRKYTTLHREITERLRKGAPVEPGPLTVHLNGPVKVYPHNARVFHLSEYSDALRISQEELEDLRDLEFDRRQTSRIHAGTIKVLTRRLRMGAQIEDGHLTAELLGGAGLAPVEHRGEDDFFWS